MQDYGLVSIITPSYNTDEVVKPFLADDLIGMGYILSFLMVHLSSVDINPKMSSDNNLVLA